MAMVLGDGTQICQNSSLQFSQCLVYPESGTGKAQIITPPGKWHINPRSEAICFSFPRKFDCYSSISVLQILSRVTSKRVLNFELLADICIQGG